MNKERNAAGTIGSKLYESTPGVLSNSLVPSVTSPYFQRRTKKHTNTPAQQMTVKPDKAITLVRSTHSFSILPRSILIRDRYNLNGVKQRWLC
jgi:hypothetical protein